MTETNKPAAGPVAVDSPAAQKALLLDRAKKMLDAAKDRFARALARKGIDPDEFVIGIMTQIHSTPKLLLCVRDSPESVLLSAFKAAIHGLRLDGVSQQAFLIPRRRKMDDKKWIMEANYQIGYQGILAHMYRSKEIKSVFAAAVYQEDAWVPPSYSERGVTFLHTPNMDIQDRGGIVAGYVRIKLVKDDEPLVYALPIHQIYREHRDVSQAWDPNDEDCPWNKYEEAMVRKTMLIYGGKYAPKALHTMDLVNVADRLDKGLAVHVPEADVLLDQPGTLTPASLTPEDIARPTSVEAENDAGPDKTAPKAKDKNGKKAAAPAAREPGEDDLRPEDEEAGRLFPDRG